MFALGAERYLTALPGVGVRRRSVSSCNRSAAGCCRFDTRVRWEDGLGIVYQSATSRPTTRPRGCGCTRRPLRCHVSYLRTGEEHCLAPPRDAARRVRSASVPMTRDTSLGERPRRRTAHHTPRPPPASPQTTVTRRESASWRRWSSIDRPPPNRNRSKHTPGRPGPLRRCLAASHRGRILVVPRIGVAAREAVLCAISLPQCKSARIRPFHARDIGAAPVVARHPPLERYSRSGSRSRRRTLPPPFVLCASRAPMVTSVFHEGGRVLASAHHRPLGRHWVGVGQISVLAPYSFSPPRRP